MLLMIDSWRISTRKLYTTYLRKWALYAVERGIALTNPSLPAVCRFLRYLVEQGLGYGAINAARCALATLLPDYEGFSFGKHPLVCRLVKGVYERRPPAPRYNSCWDVTKVFKLFREWGRNAQLTLKQLTFKLVMLLMLVTAQRGQTILALSLSGLELGETVVFRLTKLLKHNRQGEPLDSIVLKPFDTCYRLCVVRTLKAYLTRTTDLRGSEKQLLISFMRPYKAVSRDTLARWVIKTMDLAGINTQKYRSHSTRGAAASAAVRMGIPLNLILKQARWRSETSFAKYYNKRLDEDGSVGRTLLEAAL